MSRRGARWFAAIRGGFGVALLFAPARFVHAAAGRPASGRARVTARVLGGRQLLQAVVTDGDPTPVMLAVGAVTDLAHAASMLGLAVVDSRWRRAAVLDAVTATTFAAVGAVAVTTARSRPAGRVRRAADTGQVSPAAKVGTIAAMRR